MKRKTSSKSVHKSVPKKVHDKIKHVESKLKSVKKHLSKIKKKK